MKLTKTGYRISKNGKINTSIESNAIERGRDFGNMIKVNSVYYFLDRKQGTSFIYLP